MEEEREKLQWCHSGCRALRGPWTSKLLTTVLQMFDDWRPAPHDMLAEKNAISSPTVSACVCV